MPHSSAWSRRYARTSAYEWRHLARLVLRPADPAGRTQPSREIPGAGGGRRLAGRPDRRSGSLRRTRGSRLPRVAWADGTDRRDVWPAWTGLRLHDLRDVP